MQGSKGAWSVSTYGIMRVSPTHYLPSTVLNFLEYFREVCRMEGKRGAAV